MRFYLLAAAAAAVLGVQVSPASADGWWWHKRHHRLDDSPQYVPYTPPAAVPGALPPGPIAPDGKAAPVNPMVPPQAGGGAPSPDFAPVTSAALGDTSFAAVAPGYIDFAKPMNQIRFRYDSAYDMNRPDRAEFFYAKCGCFPGAPGPLLPERNVDAQEASLYVELASSNKFSVFFDLPFRFINPEINDNSSGLGDVRFGFKYAFINDDCQTLTLQVRGWAPSGNARLGLGNNHYTVEPSLLYYRQLSDKVTLYGEFGDWIPLTNSDFAGNVLYYGAGVGYTAYQSESGFKVTPLVEFIGWSVLDGMQFNPDLLGAQDASGDFIANGKIGVRAGGPRNDFYVGYGRALTGEVWYNDIWRFEYRIKF